MELAKLKPLGDLERAVMDHLWNAGGPQTVRQVHYGLRVQRDWAYTTVMTVLRRLACKDLVIQLRDDRAYRYFPAYSRDELIAGLMVDLLDQVCDKGGRRAALMHFVEKVGADEAGTLLRALAEAKNRRPGDLRSHPHGRALLEAVATEWSCDEHATSA